MLRKDHHSVRQW